MILTPAMVLAEVRAGIQRNLELLVAFAVTGDRAPIDAELDRLGVPESERISARGR